MTQSRRVSPRIPYDEAICLARVDGKGRLYGRGLDLSASGLSVLCAEACPIGTEIRCNLLLPHGPRAVAGKIVRVTSTAGGFELALAFDALTPATAAILERLIAARSQQAMPAKLRIDGIDHPLRCEAHVDDQVVRLTATLPFLRLDRGVDVVLGEQGAIAAAGTIRKIAVDPSTSDGVPRLALDVALDDGPRTRTRRYGKSPVQPPRVPKRPPTNLPPPCDPALPSVVVSAGLARDLRAVEARPPRRRIHGTAEIARRPDLAPWGWQPAMAMATPAPPVLPVPPTQRLSTLHAIWWTRAAWGIVPLVVIVAAALLHLGR
ncbi:MAG TPA: PilZ domain-containing protein [Polyangia bacterium]|nr:PilZ domain-containing protein [Polyangia bacterium]